MITRNLWLRRVSALWKDRSIVWLSGVRRVGKTTLAKQVAGSVYLNCDLPSVRRALSDPEFFLASKRGSLLVLDEVHRIDDPSQLLKIAADEFPDIQILATGSSTLAATGKFRDTLTDRKRSLHLSPVLWSESREFFGIKELERRCLLGGLPGCLLANKLDPIFYEDWVDSFYARDIQELFNVRNRTGFVKVLHLMGLQSGGQLDISAVAKKSGVSRPTVMSYLDAMEIAHAVYRVSPFFGGGHREIIKQPKAYLFDTGFVSHIKGWESLRPTDLGCLWEHLVLDELRFVFPWRQFHYWRDKSGREVDFIVERGNLRADTYEAKLSPDAFEVNHLVAFRELYPQGTNYVMCPYIDSPYMAKVAGLSVVFTSVPVTHVKEE